MFIPYQKSIILVLSFLTLPYTYSMTSLRNLAATELADALLIQTPEEQSASLDGLSEEIKAAIKEAVINKYRVELTSPLVFQLHQYRGHTGRLYVSGMIDSVAFTSDGKQALINEYSGGYSAAYQYTPYLWDLTTGKCIKTLDSCEIFKKTLKTNAILTDANIEAHTGAYKTVFNTNKTRALTASKDQTIRLWDLVANTYTEIHMHTTNVYVGEVAFSPDDKTVLIIFDSIVPHLLDLNTGAPIAVLSESNTYITELAISPDSKTAVTTDDNGHLRLWDLNTGQCIKQSSMHTNNVSSIAFSPDGKTALTGSLDKTARLWKLPNLETLSLEQLLCIIKLNQAPINLDNPQACKTLESFTPIIDTVATLPALDYPKNPLIKAYIDHKRKQLLEAAAHDDVATVMTLVERGFNFNTCDKAGNNIWHYAFKGTNGKPSEKVLEFLLSLKGHVQGIKHRNSAGLPAFIVGILHHREFMLAFLNKYYIPASPDFTSSNTPDSTNSNAPATPQGNKTRTARCTIQ